MQPLELRGRALDGPSPAESFSIRTRQHCALGPAPHKLPTSASHELLADQPHTARAPAHGAGPGEGETRGIKGDGSPADLSHQERAAGSGEYDELGAPCPPHTTERKLVARIDLHLLPFISILYLLAFLDRVNVANARSFSLTSDLHLEGTEYNTILTIFFVPYVFFEIPSNLLLKRLSPRVWLSVCGVMFGMISVFQGLTQNYSGILATRFFLGLFECGMFPGCFYLLGMWYRRHEAQKRFTFFFSSTSLAGAFGGLLASAIGKSKPFTSALWEALALPY